MKEEFIMSKIKSFFKDESGQGMTEYALIIALIVLAVALVLPGVGTAISNKFTAIVTALT